MLFYVTIEGKGYDTEALHLDGASGKIYEFLWSKEHSRYLHAPKSQEECDDIFKTMNPEALFFFSVLVTDFPAGGAPSSSAGVKRPGPTLEPRYYQDLEVDELAALAKDCGIIQGINSTQDGGLNDEQRRRETWRRILDAYYLGAGWKAANPKAEPPAPPVAPESASVGTDSSVTQVIEFPLQQKDELRVIEYVQANLKRLRTEQPTIFAAIDGRSKLGRHLMGRKQTSKVKTAAPAPSEPNVEVPAPAAVGG